MPRSRPYFTLLERTATNAPWGVAFGDYTRQVVYAEMEDQIEASAYKRAVALKLFCIVRTGDAQADIDAKVAELNAKLAQPNG